MEIDPKIISEATWLFWEVIVKDIIKKSTSTAWKRFKHHEAKQKYQKRVKEIYSTMRVLYKLETVSLNDYYVDLFILEEPEAYRRYGVDYLESNFNETIGFYNRSNRSDAFLIANEYNLLFVLGKPGAGKTTLLKYLATLAAEEKIGKVPIFISFNSWAYSEKNLFEFIIEQFDICGFPDAEMFIEQLLKKGNALILFDGLDEISDEGNVRGKMIHELENLVTKYKDNKFIITCRNAANDYKFTGFTYVEIADLTDIQVSVFVKKWFSSPTKATNFLTELTKEENQSLKELSHNPLLLGMLCFVFEETSSFPPKRGLVYKEAIEALTKRWDKEQGVQRDKIPGFSPGVMIVRTSLVNERPTDVNALIEAWSEAVDYWESNPIESLNIIASYYNLPPDSLSLGVEEGIDTYSRQQNMEAFTPGWSGSLYEIANLNLNYLVETGGIRRVSDINKLINWEFVGRAIQETN